jgi:hypothetical protein
MAQAIEHVSSKHEALMSNPSTARKKKKKKGKKYRICAYVVLGNFGQGSLGTCGSCL